MLTEKKTIIKRLSLLAAMETKKKVPYFPMDACDEATKDLIEKLIIVFPEDNWKIVEGKFKREGNNSSGDVEEEHFWLVNNREDIIDPTAGQYWQSLNKVDQCLIISRDDAIYSYYLSK